MTDTPRVLVGGGPLQDWEFEDQVGADLARAELVSIPVVLVLLLVIIGGIVAAGLPGLFASVSRVVQRRALVIVVAVAVWPGCWAPRARGRWTRRSRC